MGNIITYVKENLKTFEEEPFNEVDNLVLSTLSYAYMPKLDEVKGFEGLSLTELFKAEYFQEMFDGSVMPDELKDLFMNMCASPRFRNLAVRNYVDVLHEESEIQFAAMTFELGDEKIYIAFRGTDVTFTGWKEDVNLGRKEPVASQLAAAGYLTKIANAYDGEILVGGHSKGGNLAVYAAANSHESVFNKLTKVYSNDGPGFTEENLATENFKRVSEKLTKIVPAFSLIGLIFKNTVEPKVIKSSAVAVAQHNPFSWEVEEGSFIPSEDIAVSAKMINEGLDIAAENMTDEEREEFTNALFKVLDGGESKEIASIGDNVLKSGLDIAKRFKNMDESEKKILTKTVRSIVEKSVLSIPSVIKKSVDK